MTPEHRWVFPAKALRVIDGDTLELLVDVGFRMRWQGRLRVLNVDTPEMRGSEREAGEVARAFVFDWLTSVVGEWPLLVQVERKPDSFGRALGHIWRRCDGASLAEDLLAAGMAKEYE